ncbi:hypothetical protein NDU88_006247 [Pleurodeles waltl]|uniref:Uncharacterized protein n=1 Tax=Pleurodeles waltl TaxID=8319 RepID=A0AAV7MBN8_PLEWA|nr:hypothetical protein NDU88_006247 [Pleurodeles waltl]
MRQSTHNTTSSTSPRWASVKETSEYVCGRAQQTPPPPPLFHGKPQQAGSRSRRHPRCEHSTDCWLRDATPISHKQDSTATVWARGNGFPLVANLLCREYYSDSKQRLYDHGGD